MTSLRELQLAFVDGVLYDHPARVCSLIADNGIAPQRRLAIYRNNCREGFVGTLGAAFPVVLRLAGEEWFLQTARDYMRRHPSRCGNLHRIGERFAAFLDDELRGGAYDYFADVARLEWAYQEVLVAADHPAFELRALATVAPDDYQALSFEVHPALRLVSSDYPILSIWKANQKDGIDTAGHIQLDAGPSRVLLIRREDHVELRELGAGEFALLAAFSHRQTLGEATEAAFEADASADLGSLLSRVIQLGALADFHVCRASDTDFAAASGNSCADDPVLSSPAACRA